jgi:hypothetical protein
MLLGWRERRFVAMDERFRALSGDLGDLVADEDRVLETDFQNGLWIENKSPDGCCSRL